MIISIGTMDQYMALFGLNDRNIRLIEEELSVRVHLRENTLHVDGDKSTRRPPPR